MYLFVPYVCLVSAEARRGSWINPLGLKLCMIMSHHVHAGKEPEFPTATEAYLQPYISQFYESSLVFVLSLLFHSLSTVSSVSHKQVILFHDM